MDPTTPSRPRPAAGGEYVVTDVCEKDAMPGLATWGALLLIMDAAGR